MRAPAVSFAKRFVAALIAALLTFALVPSSALAEGEGDAADAPAKEPQEVGSEQVDEGSGSTPAASPAEGGTLASALVGTPTAFINSDVALDSEPIIGSFTVDGMTFAVTEGSDVELVGVSSDRRQVTSSQEGDDSPVAPMLASGPDELETDGLAAAEAEAGGSTLALPESITYEGIDYALASIGAYAFYLSGVTDVELPASVGGVDDRAFRSSDVAAVEVADGNATYSSFGGALYDADYSSLLLIPEGKQGTVLLPKTAESAAPSVFSHCSLVTQISAEEGSAAFASENGLLYTSDLTTLLRVPAGATDITIRDGCTAIAAGALEACASLATITAPASVASISPDVFTSVPTVSLPAASVLADDPGASTGATEEPSEQAGSIPASGSTSTQLTAMVALSSTDDDLPEVDASAITVNLPTDADMSCWGAIGRISNRGGPDAVTQSAATYSTCNMTFFARGHSMQLYQRTVVWLGSDYATERVPVSDARIEANSSVPIAGVQHVNFGGNIAYVDMPPATPPYTSFDFASATQGWTLLGFSIDPASNTPIYGGTYDVNTNFYACWRANTYTIAFSANGGTGSLPGSIAATYDQSYSIASPSLSRKGYAFDGWATSASGPKAYEPAGPFENLTAADGGSVTLYAHWSPVSYPVAFDLGSFPTSDEPGSFSQEGWDGSRTFTVEDGTVALPSPVRAGMRFLSWECDQPGLLSQDGTAWALDCTALPDAPAPTLTARWSYVIDVDTPVAVTFGEYDMATGSVTVDGSANPGELDDGYDTASKRGEPVSFKSASKCDVGIEGLSCESREGIALIKAKAGQAADEQVRSAELITMQVGGGEPTSRNSVSFALDDALGKDDMAPATAFVIPAGGELSASFRLNLEECGAYVSDASAGPEPAEADLAQLTYAYRAIPYGTGEVDGSGACIEDMYIPYDAANPFGLADIKTAANDIATRGYDSQWWWVYKHLMYADERGKTIAKVKVGATYHDVQVLGLAQDRLTAPADGRELAGLTFGWKDVYGNRRLRGSMTNEGGWAATELRAWMRSDFFNALSASLRDAETGIVEVVKTQQLGNYGGVQVTSENVFAPSAYEVIGDYNDPLYFGDESASNSFRYQYYACGGTLVAPLYPSAKWWTRSSIRENWAHGIGVTARDGGIYPSATEETNAVVGVVPCFCL